MSNDKSVSLLAAEMLRTLEAARANNNENNTNSSYSSQISFSVQGTEGFVAVNNPFFIGNMNTADQDRLRDALNRKPF